MTTTARTIVITLAVDAAVLGCFYAWDCIEAARKERRYRESLAASQQYNSRTPSLTAAESAELNRLQRYETGRIDLPEYFPARAAYLAAAAGFNVDLLTGDPGLLVSLSVPQLISEITHAKTQIRRARKVCDPVHVPSPGVQMWDEHLGALKAEFRFRDEHRETFNTLDRARLEAAHIGVMTIADEMASWAPNEGLPVNPIGEPADQSSE